MVKNYKLLINEEERERILKLHRIPVKGNILKEAKPEVETLTINLNANWPDGKYILTQEQINNMSQQLQQMAAFVNQHKDSQITIQLEAGESRVTNYDREPKKDPKTGKIINTATKVDPGVLARNRSNNIVEYLKTYFEGLKLTNVELPEPIIKIGETPYDATKAEEFKKKYSQEYAAERFVRAIITLKKEYECLVGLEITIGYYKDKSRAYHRCDEAIFEFKMNGVSIGEVNLNNEQADAGWKSDVRPIAKEYAKVWNAFNSMGRFTDTYYGGTRYQTFKLDDAKAKQIMDSSKQDTLTLSLVPLVGPNTKYKIFYKDGSHSETPWVTIKNTSGVLFDGEPNLKLKRGSMSETTILTLDKCGNPIQQNQTT
jgi:hypothetical protein